MPEKTFSFKEIAALLGVTEAEVIQKAKDGGLLDVNGNPTEFAINEGILCVELEETIFSPN